LPVCVGPADLARLYGIAMQIDMQMRPTVGHSHLGECGVAAVPENKDCTSQCSTEDAWTQRKWEGNGLDVLWFDHLHRGQAFDRNGARARLVRVVQNYCESG
jgi:hypothetical protein